MEAFNPDDFEPDNSERKMQNFQADSEERRLRVYQSEDEERKFVHDPDEDFTACFAHGEWSNYRVNTVGMKELDPEDDMYEVAMILRQARKALRLVW